MTTFPLFRLLISALALSACASPPPSSDTGIIGTWRWVSVEGKQVPEPFYARYYPDGKAATWPAPQSWSDSKGVSRGRYSVVNGHLILETGSGADNPKSRVLIQKNQMTLTTHEGYRLIYRRVVPPIEPGKLEDGSAAGYAKHPM